MDKFQRRANRHVLVITADYMASDYCRHEMEQAIKSDPGFADGKVLPILQDGTPLPPELAGAGGLGSGPLYVDLRDDKSAAAWELLLKSCSSRPLGVDAPTWLRALDLTRTHLERGESVNLVVRNGDVDWRLWFDQLRETRFKDIAVVDLEDPRAVPRKGLIGEILKATGRSNAAVPPPHDDLPFFGTPLRTAAAVTWRSSISTSSRTATTTAWTSSTPCAGLSWMREKLVLLAQTKVPIANLLPPSMTSRRSTSKRLSWDDRARARRPRLVRLPRRWLGGSCCSTGGPSISKKRLRHCRR